MDKCVSSLYNIFSSPFSRISDAPMVVTVKLISTSKLPISGLVLVVIIFGFGFG